MHDDARNERRLQLIGKKYSGGLSDEEAVELEGHKAWLDTELARRFPRGEKIDEQLARIARLAERKKVARGVDAPA